MGCLVTRFAPSRWSRSCQATRLSRRDVAERYGQVGSSTSAAVRGGAYLTTTREVSALDAGCSRAAASERPTGWRIPFPDLDNEAVEAPVRFQPPLRTAALNDKLGLGHRPAGCRDCFCVLGDGFVLGHAGRKPRGFPRVSAHGPGVAPRNPKRRPRHTNRPLGCQQSCEDEFGHRVRPALAHPS